MPLLCFLFGHFSKSQKIFFPSKIFFFSSVPSIISLSKYKLLLFLKSFSSSHFENSLVFFIFKKSNLNIQSFSLKKRMLRKLSSFIGEGIWGKYWWSVNFHRLNSSKNSEYENKFETFFIFLDYSKENLKKIFSIQLISKRGKGSYTYSSAKSF